MPTARFKTPILEKKGKPLRKQKKKKKRRGAAAKKKKSLIATRS